MFGGGVKMWHDGVTGAEPMTLWNNKVDQSGQDAKKQAPEQAPQKEAKRLYVVDPPRRLMIGATEEDLSVTRDPESIASLSAGGQQGASARLPSTDDDGQGSSITQPKVPATSSEPSPSGLTTTTPGQVASPPSTTTTTTTSPLEEMLLTTTTPTHPGETTTTAPPANRNPAYLQGSDAAMLTSTTPTTTTAPPTTTTTTAAPTGPPPPDENGRQPLRVGVPVELQGKKLVSFTFDDGPNPDTTPRLLDILAKYNVKGTFFIVGQRVAGNEDILKRMVDEGHLVCNHSWDHSDLTTLSEDQVDQQIDDTDQVIKDATGYITPMLRPPYGAYDDNTLSYVKKPFVLWNLDSRDWESRDTDAIVKKVNDELAPGDCVLFHDIYDTTVDAVEKLIPQLIDNGYSFVRTDELMTTNGQPMRDDIIYYSQPEG